MRKLCVQAGADLTYTEMVSSKALSYSNEKTLDLLKLASNEKKIAVQIFGHEPDVMASQAAQVAKIMGSALAYIDVNMGCPARKIVSKGDGSKLMTTPDLAMQIVSEIRNATDVPISCKFRRGYNLGEETAVEFAEALQSAGANALTVHGRYAMQYYHGKSDWDVIARVKKAVEIPVVASGDVVDGKSALELFALTGCDAIMIGRAAQGAPWIFAEVKAALTNNGEAGALNWTCPDFNKRIEIARSHARMISESDPKQLVRMRKHAAWYMAGFPNARAWRHAMNQCVTLKDFEDAFDEVLLQLASFENEGSGEVVAQCEIGAGKPV